MKAYEPFDSAEHKVVAAAVDTVTFAAAALSIELAVASGSVVVVGELEFSVDAVSEPLLLQPVAAAVAAVVAAAAEVT